MLMFNFFNLKKVGIKNRNRLALLRDLQAAEYAGQQNISSAICLPGAFFFKRNLQKLEAEKGKFDLVIFRGQGTFEQLWPLRDERFVYVCENIIKPHHYGALSSIVLSRAF